uniref:Uncharacterized protein n=1 Tax=Arundo donax TaxID=35708 RepID=A0A0A9BC88_ARUDO
MLKKMTSIKGMSASRNCKFILTLTQLIPRHM